MKTLMLLGLGFVAAGCLEVGVKTTVNADGSSERAVHVTTDKQERPEAAFPLPSDSSWSITWQPAGEKKQGYEFTAMKRFATPGELAAEYASRSDTALFGLRVSLDRRFEWFYTYVDYREAYSIRSPFRRLPLESYLTAAEIERVRSGMQLDDSLGRKLGDWVELSALEEFLHDLVGAATMHGLTDVAAALEARRGDIRSIVRDNEMKGVEDGMQRLNGLLGMPAVMELLPAARESWKRIEKAMERLQTADGTYRNSVTMPGLILETNSASVEGATASWEVDAKRLLAGEYAMSATSRVVNVWAFVVTALAGIALLALVLVRVLPRRAPPA
jgi:hypothetical protein